MASAPTKVRRLGSLDDLAFEAFWAIYTEAIPAREQKSRPHIEALLAREDYQILLLERDGEVLGFSILFVPGRSPFFLLEYLAIHHAHRQGGFGGDLLQQTLQAGFSDSNRTCCLIEVESPREGDSEWESQARRQRFYRKHGCRAIEGLAYLLPLPGETPPPPMDLMVHFPLPQDAVARAEIGTWLGVVYADVYGCAADDSRISSMLKAVTDPARLI